MSILQRLYDSEINCGIQSFWDGGFAVWVGDPTNGFVADEDFRTFAECESWLESTARALYPESKFARAHVDNH